MKRKKGDVIGTQLALPFQETDEIHLKEIFDELEECFNLIKDSNQRLLDLGAGNGKVIFYSALNYGIKAVGIEINHNLVLEAKRHLKILKLQKKYPKERFKKIKIKEGDIFEEGVSDYDYIYVFSLPTFNMFLRDLLVRSKDSVVLICYKYPLSNMEEIIELKKEVIHHHPKKDVKSYFYIKRK